MIQIKLFEEEKLNGYTLIEGFPGAGLVGPMANSYMIERLSMKYIGYIESDAFPPIAAVHNGTPMFPVRIYKDDRYKIVVVISEFTIPLEVIRQLGDEIVNFVRKQGIKEVISISGMPVQKPGDNAYAIASTKALMDKAKNAGINPINEGVVAGVSALILSYGMLFNLPVLDILVQVDPAIMDPKYAVIAITNLKKIINIEINTAELEKESKLVETKVREILKNTRDSHESYKNAVDATGPSTYV